MPATSLRSCSICEANSSSAFLSPASSSIFARRSSIERLCASRLWRRSSMRRRASSSSNSAASACPVKAQAATRRTIRRSIGSVFAVVEHVVAAVLRPAAFGVVGAHRLLLAEAHRFDLAFLGAEQDQRALHRVGATLAEAEVVLAAAALVGVALEQHLRARVLAQVLGVRLDQPLVFILDLVL